VDDHFRAGLDPGVGPDVDHDEIPHLVGINDLAGGAGLHGDFLAQLFFVLFELGFQHALVFLQLGDLVLHGGDLAVQLLDLRGQGGLFILQTGDEIALFNQFRVLVPDGLVELDDLGIGGLEFSPGLFQFGARLFEIAARIFQVGLGIVPALQNSIGHGAGLGQLAFQAGQLIGMADLEVGGDKRHGLLDFFGQGAFQGAHQPFHAAFQFLGAVLDESTLGEKHKALDAHGGKAGQQHDHDKGLQQFTHGILQQGLVALCGKVPAMSNPNSLSVQPMRETGQ